MGIFRELEDSSFIPKKEYAPTQRERKEYASLVQEAVKNLPPVALHSEEGVWGWHTEEIEDLFPDAEGKTKNTFHIGEVFFSFFRDRVRGGFFIHRP